MNTARKGQISRSMLCVLNYILYTV